MNSPARDGKKQGNVESKWGYAVAGGIALAFAAVIQVAFGGLDEETLANMPAIVAVPYGIAGKLGVTVPLAVLGLALIARDMLANAGTGKVAVAAPARGRRAAGGESELEFGEPIPDEVAAPTPPVPTKKTIPAGPAKKPAAPAAPQPAGAGGMVLSSAKYLTGGVPGGAPRGGSGAINGGGMFRKGRTQHTTDSDE